MAQDKTFQTGAELLAKWGAHTREAKLERACMALMDELDAMHKQSKLGPLKYYVSDRNITCSCMDAYRMGDEALKKSSTTTQEPQPASTLVRVLKGSKK